MSNISIQKGGSATIDATVPAGRGAFVSLILYGPNGRLSAGYAIYRTQNADGSTSVTITLNVPDLWFTGNAATAFIDCGQCGYGTGRYVVVTRQSGVSPYELEIASGVISVDAPPPSQGLLEEECPGCSDNPSPPPGTPPNSAGSANDPLTQLPSPPTGDPCLPPDFVNPTPTVPTPCSP